MGVVTGAGLLGALALSRRGGQGGPPRETDSSRGLQGDLRHLQRPRGAEDAGARRRPYKNIWGTRLGAKWALGEWREAGGLEY